jgi:hypothetical protein
MLRHVFLQKWTDVSEVPTEGYRTDDDGSKHLWNVGPFLPDHTTQHPRRQSSSYSPPWEPEVSPEPWSSSSSSQQSANGPYPKPDEFRPHTPVLFKIRFNIILYLRLGLRSGLLSSGYSTKILYAFLVSTVCATCLVNIMLMYSKSKNYEALIMQFPPVSCYSLLGLNILLAPCLGTAST